MAAAAAAAATAPLTEPPSREAAPRKSLLLYDGICRLCSSVVKFCIQRDPAASISFCSIQSEAANPVLASIGLSREEALKSFTVVQPDGRVLRRSDAAFALASQLDWPWPLLAAVAAWVPRFLRDFVYDCVARSRYTVFGHVANVFDGKTSSDDGDDSDCLLPTRAILSRMLDADEIRAAMRQKSKKKE